MKLAAVRIFVAELDPAITFYRDLLGLEVIWDGGEAIGFAAGQITLILEREDPAGPDGALVGRFAGLSFASDDIDARYRELAARGVRFEGPPTMQAWGGLRTDFQDPSGNILTLIG
ncbi:MAG: VOC family protein [Pikeienuella sp.]